MGNKIVDPDFALDVINRRYMDIYGVVVPVDINLFSCVYSVALRLDTNKFLVSVIAERTPFKASDP